MNTPLTNRKSRRAAQRRTKPAALAGAALAATALTAAVAPSVTPIKTADIDVSLAATQLAYPMFGIGPMADLGVNLLNAAGMNPLDVAGFITYNLQGGAATTKGIYDLVNGLPFTPKADLSGPCASTTSAACRTAFLLSIDIGSIGAVDAVQALIESARGNTRDGFEPLANYVGAKGGMTNVSGIYLNDMIRPNGGLVSRFPDISNALGFNPTMPAVGQFGDKELDGAKLYNFITDVTWPYNPVADFPITFSPLALVNSALATLPPPSLIQDGLALLTADTPEKQIEALGVLTKSIAGSMYSPNGGDGGTSVAVNFPTGEQCGNTCTGFNGLPLTSLLSAVTGNLPADFPATYPVLAANSTLPITVPMYLASTLINPVLKALNSPYLLGTAAADILTEPLRIMVNIAYNDVITPAKLNAVNPLSIEGQTYAESNYKAYDRTLAQATPEVPTAFSPSGNPALSQAEVDQAQADAMTAFNDAVTAQKEKPFFGILVPNVTPLPEPVAASTVAAPAEAVSAPATGGNSAKADAGDNDNSGGGHSRSARSGRG
jgi:hypothetical protein